MARYLFDRVVRDERGNVVESATVSVFLAGTTTAASIYAASSGGTAVNSVDTDSNGRYLFYVDTADYATSQKFDLVITATGKTTITYSNVVIFIGPGDVAGPSSAVSGDVVSFSGTTGKVLEDSGVSVASVSATISASSSHISNTSNPHSTTAAQVSAIGSAAGTLNALSEKTSLADNDVLLIEDSADSYTQKKAKKSNVASSFVPRSYLAGLGLSNATDTEHDITVAAGVCMDSSNTYNMTLASALTKQIDATWAAGTNAGGLFSGTVGNATWYHVFLIRKDSDGSIDAGFDTSVTAANIPAGYTAYRRLGSVLTNGSANIIQFVQFGDDFFWASPILDVNSTDPGTNAVTTTLSTPLGVVVKAMLNLASDSPAANENRAVYLSSLNVTDMAASNSAAPLGQIGPYSSAVTDVCGNTFVYTNTSSQIRVRSAYTTAGIRIRIATLGWIDRRGRDN